MFTGFSEDFAVAKGITLAMLKEDIYRILIVSHFSKILIKSG